jgi:hypothetical protein
MFRLCPNLLEVQTFRCSGTHGSIFACIYLFNLNLKIFAGTRSYKQHRCIFSVIENTITKIRFNDESYVNVRYEKSDTVKVIAAPHLNM